MPQVRRVPRDQGVHRPKSAGTFVHLAHPGGRAVRCRGPNARRAADESGRRDASAVVGDRPLRVPRGRRRRLRDRVDPRRPLEGPVADAGGPADAAVHGRGDERRRRTVGDRRAAARRAAPVLRRRPVHGGPRARRRQGPLGGHAVAHGHPETPHAAPQSGSQVLRRARRPRVAELPRHRRPRVLARPGRPARDARDGRQDGRPRGARRLVHAVGLQGVAAPHLQAVPRQRAGHQRGRHADGLRRHRRDRRLARLQDRRRRRAVLLAQKEGALRVRFGRDRPGRHARLVARRRRPGHDACGVLRDLGRRDGVQRQGRAAGGRRPGRRHGRPVRQRDGLRQRDGPRPLVEETVRAVHHAVPARLGQDPPAVDHDVRAVGRRGRRARPDRRARARLRPGGRRRPHGAHRRAPDRHRGRRRRPALARPVAHPTLRQVRRLPQGRAAVVPPPARVRPLPAVHVPPAPLAVPPALQLVARRGRLLPHDPRPREHRQLARHDPADAPLVLLRRPAARRPPRRLLGPTRLHPAPRHLLLRHRLPRRDHRRVARAGLPEPRRTRPLQEPAHAASRRRDGHHGRAVPAAPVHRVRPAQVRGALPHLQAQPLRDAQLDRHPRGPGHPDRRRLAQGLHGAPHEARRRELSEPERRGRRRRRPVCVGRPTTQINLLLRERAHHSREASRPLGRGNATCGGGPRRAIPSLEMSGMWVLLLLGCCCCCVVARASRGLIGRALERLDSRSDDSRAARRRVSSTLLFLTIILFFFAIDAV
mmetsp:Transcript_19657/g.78232  ORF Transcript_19657/g.78232 Transcript_19657/m.78232 type:complete len:764 (+) Transcript_19657:677-2968(+)